MRYVLLAGVVGALLLPAAADAGETVPRGFVGVMADGPLFSAGVPLGREVDLMASAGVEAVRVSFFWSTAQPYPPGTPLPPGYVDVDGVPTSFAGPDALVAEAARRHLDVLPVVLAAPAWAREDPAQTWSPPAPGAYSRYASFMAALVRRYKPGGTFWAQRPRSRTGPHPRLAGVERAERPSLLDDPAGPCPLRPDAPGGARGDQARRSPRRGGPGRPDGQVVAGPAKAVPAGNTAKCRRSGPQPVFRRGAKRRPHREARAEGDASRTAMLASRSS